MKERNKNNLRNERQWEISGLKFRFEHFVIHLMKVNLFSHSLYFARDEMAAEYDELLQQVEHFQMMNFLDNAIQLCVWLCACRFRRIRMMLKECVGFLTKLTYCGVTSLKPMQLEIM
ncbi:conserved hypothetical protein [Trichinella spiralis]|uniref:hypothetical protein n=1 Tax=Trichinella spiralis TaxID=6334 RepID=UPI0001EFD2CD|nr:conserved hypothetical protein [Trichinella spiralis]